MDFLPHPSSPARRGSYFSKTPPSPLDLKRGSTSLLNPPLLRREGLNR